MHHQSDVVRLEVVALSLAAALLYALTSVLQQSAAATVPLKLSLRPSLIIELVRRPRWLLGNLTDVAAFGLQFLALRRGSLLLVQTLLVTGLLFALPIGAAASRQRLRPLDWLAVIAVVVGLSAFLLAAMPGVGKGEAPGAAWGVVLGSTALVVAILVRRAPPQPAPARASCLGAACGVLYGLTAALTKSSGHLLDHGRLHALTSWEPYAWAGLSGLGFLLSQSAFQAGPLEASLPLLTIADPVVSSMIGVLAFHEHIAARPLAVVVELAAGAAMVFGVFALARSPLVRPTKGAPIEGTGDRSAP